MNNRNFVLCILFLSLISMSSCIKNGCDKSDIPYQKLTDSIKVWLPYTSNTNIVFEDENFGTDTVHLLDYFSGDDDFYRGEECPMGKGQFVRCNFFDSITNDTILVEIGYQYKLSIARKTTYAIYDGSVNQVYFTNSNGGYVSSILLNRKNFYNCIWSECTSSNGCNQTGITKFYFAKHYGLVAYYKNNVLYTVK